jgi:tetratricopeptide (TPR) repeat protein
MLIGALDKNGDGAPALADAARTFLANGLAADSRCINCLFGMVVVDLHMNIQPEQALIDRLADALRSGHVDATKVSISQMSYLVKWQRSDGFKLDPGNLESIFNAALENPAWNHSGRAGIEAAYRDYYELVADDLPNALQHAQAAVQSWPEQWGYRMNLARILVKMGRTSEALAALDEAALVADNQTKQSETSAARVDIEHSLKN